ncbi:hypothetical protein [Paenibacillus sp. Leaf72]|uniref:hypothetical protein n=1 Tax=Paenibacillus sp. Leaf72 TaxID=1736234 RepID=UPI0006F677DF|nr:hypothetical protein [Paenibacillus sp. Leaf72]KQO17291.1 hypothetical protein ASF12_00935 [Paenibacillus sp. Leaf72]
MPKSWIHLTIGYFLVTAVTGLLMRSMAYVSLPGLRYDYLLHAHSHLALLGWGYMALFLLFLAVFFNSASGRAGGVFKEKKIRVMLVITQLTLAGMFFAFCIQGYAAVSISFSTLQILLSYWFAGWAWRRLAVIAREGAKPERGVHSELQQVQGTGSHPSTRQPLSFLFVKGSLLCLVISSLGPWGLAMLSANGLKGSPLYEAAIYFYLHFQYNGWFTLGLFAVLLRLMEQRQITYSVKIVRLLFWMYALAMPPAFLLSVLWLKIGLAAQLAAALAAVIQWAAILLFCAVLLKARFALSAVFTGWAARLLVLALLLAAIKATLELGLIVPQLAEAIYQSRSIVIGYLHLTLLGFVSCLCLALFLQQGWLNGRGRIAYIGYMSFIAGFMLNELTLFLQGLFDWTGHGALVFVQEAVWAASLIMVTGIALFWGKRKAAQV